MLDGLGSIFKGRFNLNSLLTFTFIACCVDAASCLVELRVPCCAAFCLEMTMAMAARCQRRSTEMGQMDTLRKPSVSRASPKFPTIMKESPVWCGAKRKSRTSWTPTAVPPPLKRCRVCTRC